MVCEMRGAWYVVRGAQGGDIAEVLSPSAREWKIQKVGDG